MGLAYSQVSACCRRNVIVTDNGESVALTAQEFDSVDIESDLGGNFYISPDLRVITHPPRHWSYSGSSRSSSLRKTSSESSLSDYE
ncbi:myristylated tegument protein [Pteropodid alphaherpesvirus 1]|uniref:Myristylated tegument protein n=1 Tax=Pteropodid alphaherpesvirus 1 TaxID=1343901 RepID=A0A060Q4Y5_9ALPH|nr:myristylated tegument protein [Pteropodid alphaherpesvirus 1]BAP00690.1 myristylated tegument protein [Pteropodid alphaherpesvirus 1]